MSSKISADHLGRGAVVYVRQSTMAQVIGNLESQRRQYDLAGTAKAAGFTSVTVIDDDLGRSGSGRVVRPGLERLVVVLACSVKSAPCIVSRLRVWRGTGGTGTISLTCVLLQGPWSSIRMASTIHDSSTTGCFLGSRGRCRNMS